MKKALLSLLLISGVVLMAAPRVSRGTLAAMEKSIDKTISSLWQDNAYLLLGSTRGVYLDGYGAVFTAEVNLVPNPISLMNTRLTPADIAKFHQTKVERVGMLKKTLTDTLVSTAASLDTVPSEEKITIVAFLDHFSWEDMSGVPVQITVEGQKKALIDAQKSGTKASAVRVTEN